ncbi:MAG: TrmH family RNA methyltransferase [Vulcanimicrobiaceae bacterium]
MAEHLGIHSPRVGELRDLRTARGRKEQRRFAFEGPTLLAVALRSGLQIDELYVSESAYERQPVLVDVEATGTETWTVSERTMRTISDLETPTGILAVAKLQYAPLGSLFSGPGLILVLADLGDPGNVGTLMRAAEAFGARGVVVGTLGVDPFHPKVVRSAMGTIFRMPLARAEPAELADVAAGAKAELIGLDVAGSTLGEHAFGSCCAIIVGHERQGLGRWAPVCSTTTAIPMVGPTESLNAAVAGGIALYAASQAMAISV